MPDPAHCEWGTTGGEWGRAWRRCPQQATPGNPDCWGSNWAVKPCSCQHETTQHQLSSSHVSAKFSEKSPETIIFVLARLPTLTQPPACSAQLATDRSEHKCGQHCPTSMVAQEFDFAPAMPQFNSQLPGIFSPNLRKCTTLCLMTVAVNTASSTNTLVRWACRKPSLSLGVVSFSITTQGKL